MRWITHSLGISLVAVLLLFPPVGLASHFKSRLDPDLIKFCVNQLLFEDTFPNGRPVGDRTIIDPQSAARACQGVTDKRQALDVKRCMNGLLFDRTFSDGDPVGERTIIDPASASEACQVYHPKY